MNMGTRSPKNKSQQFGSAIKSAAQKQAAPKSGLRKLKTGVTSVVKVRRSSDDVEADFTADEITDGTLIAWTGANDGFVKLIFDAKYGELLGGHMIGANVTEMVAELVAIRKLETTGHQLIKTIHPHPTMSEAIMEAAAAAYDEAIHI